MTRLFAALLASASLASPALAGTAVGLAGDRTLVLIDSETAAVTGMVEVEGVTRLLGIDWRPGTGQLIGVTDGQAVVAIDPATGATEMLSQMDRMLPVADMPVVVDVNPAADRLRFMSGLVNHRVNMDTGEVIVDGDLHFDAADTNAATGPMVVGTAYTNAYGKPESTAMYNIDAGLGALIRQTAPNDGTLATIGSLGVMTDGPIAFDVATNAAGENTAWLSAGGMLHQVDLESGMVSGSWPIAGAEVEIRDLTVMPAM